MSRFPSQLDLTKRARLMETGIHGRFQILSAILPWDPFDRVEASICHWATPWSSCCSMSQNCCWTGVVSCNFHSIIRWHIRSKRQRKLPYPSRSLACSPLSDEQLVHHRGQLINLFNDLWLNLTAMPDNVRCMFEFWFSFSLLDSLQLSSVEVTFD
jgi:hypothetical protein